MPNTREKLIDLLQDCVCENLEPDDPFVGVAVEYGNIADHLIANGVTFAKDNNVPIKWIPVTERLPVEDVKFLAVVKEDGYDRFAFAVCSQGKWWDCLYNGFHNVTHWMYLPEPPKGE